MKRTWMLIISLLSLLSITAPRAAAQGLNSSRCQQLAAYVLQSDSALCLAMSELPAASWLPVSAPAKADAQLAACSEASRVAACPAAACPTAVSMPTIKASDLPAQYRTLSGLKYMLSRGATVSEILSGIYLIDGQRVRVE